MKENQGKEGETKKQSQTVTVCRERTRPKKLSLSGRKIRGNWDGLPRAVRENA